VVNLRESVERQLMCKVFMLRKNEKWLSHKYGIAAYFLVCFLIFLKKTMERKK
jgi:hypothetical protein